MSWLIFAFVLASSFSGLLKANTFVLSRENSVNSFEDIVIKASEKEWNYENTDAAFSWGLLHDQSDTLKKFWAQAKVLHWSQLTDRIRFDWVLPHMLGILTVLARNIFLIFSYTRCQKVLASTSAPKGLWKST